MWLKIVQETFADYLKRYWRFWAVLYASAVLAEVMREIFLENTVSLTNQIFGQTALTDLLAQGLRSPLAALSFLGMVFFNGWGFASLYFLFSGTSFAESVEQGFKRALPYIVLMAVGGIAVIFGVLVLSAPALIIFEKLSVAPVFNAAGSALNPLITLPVILLFGIPGWWLFISFAVAPLVLLLENRGVLDSLKESYQRVSITRREAVPAIVGLFVLSGAAYYFLMWVVFSLKLIFIPDLSFRGETSLRIFIYSIPWVIAASFFDLGLYYIYLRLKPLSGNVSAGSSPGGDGF